MEKFSLDYAGLQSKLSTKKMYRLADVQHKLKRVAFDVVRFVDNNNIDELWKIERDGDDEYIVAMYDENQMLTAAQTKTASDNPWQAIPDSNREFVHIFFKDNAIKRLAMKDLGVPSEDAVMICGILKSKFASDANFLRNFVNELTEDERAVLTDAEPSLLSSK
jgi:hypothetical protein